MSRFERRPARVAPGPAVAIMALLAASVALPALAEPAPPLRVLLSGLARSPAAAEAAAHLDAARARARQSAARSNPTLSVEVENAFGDGPFSDFDRAETTVSVAQDLDLWGRRRALTGAAAAEADAAALRGDLALVDAASRLARAYAEAEAAGRRFDLAQEALGLTLADARAAAALVEEGREPRVRALQAEAESAAARARLDEARAERDAAYAALTTLAALPAPVTAISDSVLDRTAGAPASGAGASLSERIAQADRAAAEGRIDAERASGRPNPTASLGVRRFQAEDASAMTFGFSLPLPLFDRNRGAVEAAEAELRAADARAAGAALENRAGLAAARLRLQGSASRVTAADAGAAAAEEAYRLSRIGAEAGRMSQLELRVSRAALIDARIAAVDARLARAVAEIDLSRLQGRMPFGDPSL